MTRGPSGWLMAVTLGAVVVSGCGSDSTPSDTSDTDVDAVTETSELDTTTVDSRSDGEASDAVADTIEENTSPDAVATDTVIVPADSEKCLQLCEAAPDSPCESDRPRCLDDCRARTQDIPVVCARCITDNSEAMFGSCIDFGNGPSCGCDEAVFSTVYENGCETFCSSISVETSHSFEARCTALCGPSTAACEDEDILECRTQCSSHASGLSQRCARCLLDASTSPSGTCIDFGTGPSCSCDSATFAPISVNECATFCADG
jgi:hypothetical protein